jgi:hypothetical protein
MVSTWTIGSIPDADRVVREIHRVMKGSDQIGVKICSKLGSRSLDISSNYQF